MHALPSKLILPFCIGQPFYIGQFQLACTRAAPRSFARSPQFAVRMGAAMGALWTHARVSPSPDEGSSTRAHAPASAPAAALVSEQRPSWVWRVGGVWRRASSAGD